MKVLIWVLCFFAYAMIAIPIKRAGIILGAIPTVILCGATFGLAFILCKKWDKHKMTKDKQAVPKQEKPKRTVEEETVTEEPTDVSSGNGEANINDVPSEEAISKEAEIQKSCETAVPVKDEIYNDFACETMVENKNTKDEVNGVSETVSARTTLVMDKQEVNQPINDMLGLVPNEPIFTNGAGSQQNYLNLLRSINGEKIKWVCRGTVQVEGIPGNIDIYDAYLLSGIAYKTIYLNANGTSFPTYAPKGFSFISILTNNSIKETKKSLNNNRPAKDTSIRSKSKSKSGKSWLIIGACTVVLLTIIAITIPVARNNLYEQEYRNLLQDMQSVNGENYKKIGEQIDNLPLDFLDVSTLRDEYNQIRKNMSIIESTSIYAESDKSSAALRSAYASLIDFNDSHNNWDLTKYLESVHDEYLLTLVFGKIFANVYSEMIFDWRRQDDGSTLLTNLPNRKNSKSDYYYYIDRPNQIGYENKNDSSDKFLAYKISEIIYTGEKWRLKIFCYKDSKMYVLEASLDK